MWRQAGLILAIAALDLCPPARAETPASEAQAAAGRALLNGYRRYNGTCSHCHGPDGGGSSFAPSLIEAPLPFARFEEIVRDGISSGSSVMRGFADDPNLAPYIGDIYAYLRARADGTVGRGRPALGQ
jgi:mono/diheme cytochrome c family protein